MKYLAFAVRILLSRLEWLTRASSHSHDCRFYAMGWQLSKNYKLSCEKTKLKTYNFAVTSTASWRQFDMDSTLHILDVESWSSSDLIWATCFTFFAEEIYWLFPDLPLHLPPWRGLLIISLTDKLWYYQVSQKLLELSYLQI